MGLQKSGSTKPSTCLYIVEIIDTCVKVGISDDPVTRLAQHQRDADAYEREIGRSWVSAPHWNARENERSIMRGAKREYLKESFDDVLSRAVRLPVDDRPRSDNSKALTESIKQTLFHGERNLALETITNVSISLYRNGIMTPTPEFESIMDSIDGEHDHS